MSNEFRMVPFPRELAEVLMNTTTSSMARSEVISILAENPEENAPCPECGGSLSTWGCNCTPRWPMHKPIFAAASQPPALGGEPEATAWVISDDDGTIDATVRWDVAKHSFGEAMPMISKAVHRAHLAPLKAEIEQLKAQLAWSESDSRKQSSEIDQLKARCDEQSELLEVWRTWLGSSRESCDEPGKLLWDRIAALSKPAKDDPVEYGPTPGCKQCQEAEDCGLTDCPECDAQLCEDVNGDGVRPAGSEKV
ncbi:hypothetical protein [Pseudomonas savastanoi]|uniref:Uncharacterized protein n=1 Tax=Pseudomonas savastanoi TaxID=29438 RepID=A0AAW3LY37_PSESS|nr:hypothetical protein [Pseudomonas savastanoi]KTC59066.1 hypothetical protein AO287_21470 [Pseudomonas savastanoi]